MCEPIWKRPEHMVNQVGNTDYENEKENGK